MGLDWTSCYHWRTNQILRKNTALTCSKKRKFIEEEKICVITICTLSLGELKMFKKEL